ncbi:MAG: hypothetical protein OEV21_01490 [Thermoplasmata archaeon]|nr:hypothetical protein [Thermoplasmata archaeon]
MQERASLDPGLTRLIHDRSAPLSRDHTERIMENLDKLLIRCADQHENFDLFLSHMGDLISRLCGFSEITIASKDQDDGLYKFKQCFGMRKEAELAYKKLTYTKEDVLSTQKYPRIKMNDYLEFYPTEFRPYAEGELETYNRPSQMKFERESVEDMLEGDYLCLYFYGPHKEIAGWFELARTRDGKIPSRETFKWLELFAAITSRVYCEKLLAKKSQK